MESIISSNNSKSKLFHYSTCRYAANIKPENIILFDTKSEAKYKGYTQCSHCSVISNLYEKNRKSIDDFLMMNNLSMYIEDDSMYIENTFSSWKITTEDDSKKLKLYHGNTESYHKLEKRNGHIIHHYHLQKYRGEKDIIPILSYIIDHDNWRSNHLTESYKKLPNKTKKQRKAYKKAKKKAKKIEVRNLYNLIDRISLEMKNK